MNNRVPELANMTARSLILEGKPLVDDSIIELVSFIKGAQVIELLGGLGEVAEHLSERGNNVRLVEEGRLFFVYRRQIFPYSKVIEMNVSPSAIKVVSPYYDYAIIHSDSQKELALSMAKKAVVNVSTKEVYEKASINNTKKSREKSKDNYVIGVDAGVEQPSNDIPTVVVEQPTGDSSPSNTSSES